MTKQQEIDIAESSLAQVKNDAMSISIRLSAIEREIDVYLLNELQIVENISILKRKKIVALAEQYKKAKEELSVVRQKLVIAYNDRSQHEHTLKNVQKLLKQRQTDYDIIVSRYENNVVSGVFRRNDGQG